MIEQKADGGALSQAQRLVGAMERIDARFAELEPGSSEFARALDAAQAEFGGLVHPELEFRSHFVSAEGGGSYRGIEGARQWYEDIFASFSSFRRTVDVEYTELDADRVLMRQHSLAVGRASGAEIEIEGWVILTFHEGLLRCSETFTDRESALEAATRR